MGQIHGMEKLLTITEVAETYGRKPDTLWRKAKRTWPERKWSLFSAVTEEEGRILLGDWPAPVPAKPRKPKSIIRTPAQHTVNQPAPAIEAIPPAPGRAKRQWPVIKWPTFGLSEFLALAVYGHTALVWYELWVIFQVPGILAGVVLFALKHAAVVICRSAKYEDYAADALGVAFVLDGLAVWVHYTAFGDAMPDRFKDGAEFWAALVLGLVVASGAFVTLYFTNKTAKQ